jgi:hypothetical protein
LVALLTNLIRKDVKFTWIDQCKKYFEEVKYVLTHAPVLILPTFGEKFEVICDALLIGIGVVLLQNGKHIALESYKVTALDRNDTTSEQESIAIVHARV